MKNLMMIFGIVMAVEGVLVYALQKVFKNLDDKEIEIFAKAMQDVHCKRYW